MTKINTNTAHKTPKAHTQLPGNGFRMTTGTRAGMKLPTMKLPVTIEIEAPAPEGRMKLPKRPID